jgi:TolB-like protein/Tfp pilus assembly protein PilF
LDSLTVPGFGGLPAIAVLPFDNLSGDPDQEYFADGIAEDLITRLSDWHEIPVIARNSSFTYKGKPVDVKQVSRELGVRYVVEGSVRKAANRVRISAQLIDAVTGAHVWAQTYDRQLQNIFAVQDDITEAIAVAAFPALLQSEARHAASKEPDSLDAWDHQMRGLWHLWKQTREDNSKARALFKKAIELEPGNAGAYAYLVFTHGQAIVGQWTESPVESVAQIERAARRCMELDNTAPTSHTAMGSYYSLRGQQAQAIAAFRRAVQLAPGSTFACGQLGGFLALIGQPEEALPNLERVMRLSPRDPVMHTHLAATGWAHFAAGRYQEAIEWLERSRQSKPDFNLAHRGLAASYAVVGRLEEARAALEEELRLEPDITIQKIRFELSSADPDFLDRYFNALRKAGMRE